MLAFREFMDEHVVDTWTYEKHVQYHDYRESFNVLLQRLGGFDNPYVKHIHYCYHKHLSIEIDDHRRRCILKYIPINDDYADKIVRDVYDKSISHYRNDPEFDKDVLDILLETSTCDMFCNMYKELLFIQESLSSHDYLHKHVDTDKDVYVCVVYDLDPSWSSIKEALNYNQQYETIDFGRDCDYVMTYNIDSSKVTLHDLRDAKR